MTSGRGGFPFSQISLFGSLFGGTTVIPFARTPARFALRHPIPVMISSGSPPVGFDEPSLRPPLVIFLPLRSSRLHRLGYLSIAIHHDFYFIALLRSSTVDDIYAAGHAVSDSCLLLSFASLNYLKIFNF